MKGSELRNQIGSLMIVGIEGPELTAIERAWLKLIQPSGVILFRRNIETSAQTFALLAEINKIIGCDIFRCVDVEGGLVDRLRDCVAPIPSAEAVAATGKTALYRRHGALIGREARALGFNTTLAPVLDLGLSVSRPVMRSRTASADPERVIEYASYFLDGLASEKVVGCGKHFPGLGRGTLDSHESTPVIHERFDELWKTDLLPYRSLVEKLPMVMVSHAAYPSALGGQVPASLSREWIFGILQEMVKFRGLVLSDDLEMGGVLAHAPIETAVVEAVAAGTHLVEICKDASLVQRGYEALLAEAEKSAAFQRAVKDAAQKVATSKELLLCHTVAKKPPTAAAINRLRNQIGAFTAQVATPSERETHE